MTLIVPAEGPCAGHLCDQCSRCRRGHCCRRDNPDYALPREGTWAGQTYGDLGVLRDDGERVQCHCCGGWFVHLGPHIWWAHDLQAREYRALFGLRQRTALAGGALVAQVRARETAHLDAIRQDQTPVSLMTAEQHSALRRGRPLPAQTRQESGYHQARTPAGTMDADARRRIGQARTARAAHYTCACGCGALFTRTGGVNGRRYIPGHGPYQSGVSAAIRAHLEQGPARAADIASAAGLGAASVAAVLGALLRRGEVVRPARGLYALADREPGR